jgi:hypothetical protein
MTRVIVIVGPAAMLAACNRTSTPTICVPMRPTPAAPQTIYAGKCPAIRAQRTGSVSANRQ